MAGPREDLDLMVRDDEMDLTIMTGELAAGAPPYRTASPTSTTGFSAEEDTNMEHQLAPLAVLLGEWITEATHPLVDAVVPGSATFEWLEGGHFLIERPHHDHELIPDSLRVIGAPEDGDGLIMEFFDSRGVRRTYGVSLDDGVLHMWRDHPGFDQRSSAKLGHDNFEVLGQLAETPGDWQDDLRVIYRRRRD